MKMLIQHYGNPLHVCCLVQRIADVFGARFNMRDFSQTRFMRGYERVFVALVY